MSRTKTIIEATPASTIQKPKVSFDRGDFNALIENHGYSTIWEKAVKCPCSNEANDHALSSCQNCGGIGWVFVNPTRSRMVVHSQNADTTYKEWSEEKIGTASLTCRDPFSLSYMDKVTLEDARNVYSERVYPKTTGGNTRAFSLYPIETLEVAFAFVQSDTILTKLTLGTDFTISDNVITFTDGTYADKAISIRYSHKPVYYIIDLPRETMSSLIKNRSTGKNEDLLMPIHAIMRRAHYVLDAENVAGDRLFDNSYS